MSGISEDCEGVSDTFRQTLLIIRGTTAGLACLTCFIALLLMAFFQIHVFCNTRKSTMCTQRLIIYLTCSALFHSICLSLQPMSYNYKNEEAENSVLLNVSCMATGFLVQYSSWVELLFTLVVTVHLVLLSFKKDYKWKELGYILFPIILPLVFSWIPFLHKNYGMYGAWCWIQKDDLKCNIFLEGMIEQFALWHGGHFIFLSISLLLLAIFFYRIRRLHQESVHKAILKQIIPLVIFSIMFQALSWFGLVNDIYRAVTQKEQKQLWYFHAVASPTWDLVAGIAATVYGAVLFKMTNEHNYKHLN